MIDPATTSPPLALPRAHDAFVGIDSDGCAFDTMGIKHRECFIPAFIKHFGLASVARFAREASEFVNLDSRWRGTNRFPAYLKALDLLAEHPGARRRGYRPVEPKALREWAARERRLSNATLAAEVRRSGAPDLALALAWSEEVNAAIEATVRGVPPFPGVGQVLEALDGRADVMVVSATPCEALAREWREHGLDARVGCIAGQEHGGKADLLALGAPADRYDRDRVLMIGDAPGDLRAARASGALFFPIEPGREEESWQALRVEGLPRFFDGTFRGAYQDDRIARFEALLPEVPPWDRA